VNKLLARIPHTKWYNSDKFPIYPELTNYCNFRCIYCPHSVYRKESAGGNQFNREKGYMSDELWNLVLENASKYASYVGLGFFGEPLLHQAFQRYIELIPRNRGYGLIIFTNWSLVTREHMQALKHFDCVVISLDASYSSLWEKLCPGGVILGLNGMTSKDRYGTIVEKIQYWLNLEGHAPTQVCCVVSSINEHDTDELVNKWRSRLGKKDVVLTKTIISYGGIMKDSHMSRCTCDVLSYHPFQVAWNGDCTPCNLDVNIEWNVGNLLDVKDIKQIVEGEQYQQTMSKIRHKEGICAKCFDGNNRPKDRLYRGTRNSLKTKISK
jgi:sulfatase maturation enzyme AslB (radical SAM superfamily)